MTNVIGTKKVGTRDECRLACSKATQLKNRDIAASLGVSVQRATELAIELAATLVKGGAGPDWVAGAVNKSLLKSVGDEVESRGQSAVSRRVEFTAQFDRTAYEIKP